VNASSLFDAAAQAGQRWAMFWWYRSDAVIEVHAGDRSWKVRGETGARVAGKRKRKAEGLSLGRSESVLSVLPDTKVAVGVLP
jgi:hypothetical protein